MVYRQSPIWDCAASTALNGMPAAAQAISRTVNPLASSSSSTTLRTIAEMSSHSSSGGSSGVPNDRQLSPDFGTVRKMGRLYPASWSASVTLTAISAMFAVASLRRRFRRASGVRSATSSTSSGAGVGSEGSVGVGFPFSHAPIYVGLDLVGSAPDAAPRR